MARRDHFAVLADGRGIQSRQKLIAWCSACAKPVKLVSFAEAIAQSRLHPRIIGSWMAAAQKRYVETSMLFCPNSMAR